MGEQSVSDVQAPRIGQNLQQIMPWTGITSVNSENNVGSCQYFSPHRSLKRKIQEPNEGQIRKQHITEDKISAHLSQLSLSPTAEKTKSELLTESLIDGLTDDSKLVLSQELRRFQQESALPASLLESFARPTMAVVLWQPRNPVSDLLLGNHEPSEAVDNPPREEAPNVIPMDDLPEDNNNEPINNFNNLNQAMAPQQLAPFVDTLDMDEDL